MRSNKKNAMLLDDTKMYEMYDKNEASYGLEHLGIAAERAFLVASALHMRAAYKTVQQVVVVGMGASALAGHVAKSILAAGMKVPVLVLSTDLLPAFVNGKTLVIAVSFSGNTKEVLSAVKEAASRRAKVCVITSGGKLAAAAKRAKVPVYVYDAGDFALSPNFAIAFSTFGLLGLLKAAQLVRISQKEVKAAIAAMVDVADTCALTVSSGSNPAKIVANALHGRTLVVFGAEHLTGSARAFSVHVREVSGQLAGNEDVPDALHTFLDALLAPKGACSNLHALTLRSSLYKKINRDQFEQLAVELEKHDVPVIDYETRGKTVLEEAAEVMQFGLFVSYYLAMLNKIAPETAEVATRLKQ